MTKKKHYVRKFLNKDEGLAAIEVSADNSYNYKECTVTLSDCHRSISLDFGFKDKKSKKAKLAKLYSIIAELQDLEHVMMGMEV